MGNCCKPASSMEWDEEDWESLKTRTPKTCPSSSSKVFDEASLVDHHQKENDVLGKLRASCDANGKVTLKISKSELAELLEAIQQNSNSNQQPQPQMKKKKELASAEQVLFRLMKAKDHEIANKHHCGHRKPVLETIPE